MGVSMTEKSRGFTLLELVVVLAIVGMLLALVLPRLPDSRHADLCTSAQKLALTLRYLQDKAATAGTTFYLRLEPGTDSVQVLQSATDGSEAVPTDPFLQQRPTREGITVADVAIPRLGKLSEGKLRVDIGAGGLRDFLTVHLKSADGEFRTVMAFPSSGKVLVYPDYQDYRDFQEGSP